MSYHRVKVAARKVGANFAVRGVVLDVETGEELATTRNLPLGSDAQALAAALDLAHSRQRQGHDWDVITG